MQSARRRKLRSSSRMASYKHQAMVVCFYGLPGMSLPSHRHASDPTAPGTRKPQVLGEILRRRCSAGPPSPSGEGVCGRACASGTLGRCGLPASCARTCWRCQDPGLLEHRNEGSTSGKLSNQCPKLVTPPALLSAKSAANQTLASELHVSTLTGSGHTGIWGSRCPCASASAAKIPAGWGGTYTLANGEIRPRAVSTQGEEHRKERRGPWQRVVGQPRGATAGARCQR